MAAKPNMAAKLEKFGQKKYKHYIFGISQKYQILFEKIPFLSENQAKMF